MRRTIFAVALLLIAALPAFAMTRTVMVVDDVIRMSQAGVGDAEIIAFINKNTTPFEINGDDVIAMQNAKVSPAVMTTVLDASVASMRAARSSAPNTHYDSSAPAQGSSSTTVVVPPAYGYPYNGYSYPYYDGYAYPYYGYGYPYYGYYSPYWWYPSVSIGFGFGYYGGYYGHGYYGHGGYYGGHGGYHGGHGGGHGGGHSGGGHGGGHGGGGHGGHH